MTEEQSESENGEQQAEQAEQAEQADAPKAAPAAVEEEAPVELQTGGSFLKKLNPLNLFKKESPERYVESGMDLLQNKNYAQATIAFNNALRLDKDSASAFRGLGDTFVKKGGRTNLKAALEHYNDSVLRDPFHEDVYISKSKIFDALGQRKEATLERKKMVVVKTLSTDPKNSIANNNMGILLLRNKQTEPAIKYFQNAVDSDQNYEVAHRNMATVYYNMYKAEQNEAKKKDMLEKARTCISRAMELLQSIPTLLIFARVLLADGEDERALEIVELAEKQDPAHKDVFGLKKVVLEKLNRMDEARDAFGSYQMFSKDAPPED